MVELQLCNKPISSHVQETLEEPSKLFPVEPTVKVIAVANLVAVAALPLKELAYTLFHL